MTRRTLARHGHGASGGPGDRVVIGDGVHLSGRAVERGVVRTAGVCVGDGR